MDSRRFPPYVGIVGPADATRHQLDHAQEAGRRLATQGWVIVTGGHGGVMGAAAAGVSEAGGTAIGLLPGFDRNAASAGHSIAIPTGLGEMRNALLVRSVDAVLAIGGSWGTLSEVALAVRTGVPVVAVHTWELPGKEIVRCTSIRDAVDRLRSMVAARPGRGPGPSRV